MYKRRNYIKNKQQCYKYHVGEEKLTFFITPEPYENLCCSLANNGTIREKKKAMFYELSHMTKHNKQQEESIPFTIVMNAGC